MQGSHAVRDAVERDADDDEQFGDADLERVVDEPGPPVVVREGSGEVGVAQPQHPRPHGGRTGGRGGQTSGITGGEHGESGGCAAERQPGASDEGYGEVEDGDVVVPAAGSVEFLGAGVGAGAGRRAAASCCSS